KTIDSALKTIGMDSLGFAGDVSSLKDLEAFMSVVKSKFGRIDILFVNAGILSHGTVAECSEEDFDKIFAINTKGAFFTVQKALQHMARGGAIVFCSSIVNQMSHPGTGAYSASKAAVRSFTRVIAAELVGQGIRVNAVSPGPIATPILGRSMDAQTLEGTKNYLNSVIPMKRMGEPIELAKAVLFLASDDSSFITGTEIVVDGGMVEI
ncbi:MAG TPA: SDR family oxidoreductase, partial [Candidatus Acidoferrum sp.]|nr:SDR family oxidoreductase [Candidatus Acidoferrum sp.]